MKPIHMILIIFLAVLQYQLWWGEGSIPSLHALKSKLTSKKEQFSLKKSQNYILIKQIHALKNNNNEIETMAREEYNMIKKDEVYFQIVESSHPSSQETFPATQ